MSCIIRLCSTSYRNNKNKLNKKTFFPVNKVQTNELLYKQWINFIGFEPKTKNPLICSDHFEMTQFKNTGDLKVLNEMAFPSLNGYFLGK